MPEITATGVLTSIFGVVVLAYRLGSIFRDLPAVRCLIA